VTLPRDGKLGPFHVQFGPPRGDDPRPAIEPIPQARFPLRSRGYVSYTEHELDKRNPRENPDVDTDHVLIVWPAHDGDARERLTAKLEKHGIRPIKWTEATDLPKPGDPDFGLVVRGVIDQIIARAVAKIAFNYLVRVTYDTYPHFALKPAFDPVREFILNGVGRWQDFVAMPASPILATDSERRRSTLGHLVTVTWKRFGGVMAQVSLFNDLTYDVTLAKHVDGVWRDVAAGHHYNPETRQAESLGHTRLIVPPPLHLPE
jgi:hypothetical protein